MADRVQAWLTAVGTGVVLTVGTIAWLQFGPGAPSALNEAHKRAAMLEQVVSRLTADARVAQVYVAAQEVDADGVVLRSTLVFQELSADDQSALPPRTFSVPGNEIYFDALVVKFSAEHVSAGDALRGRSLHLFRRVFASTQAPEEGVLLEDLSAVPRRYALPRTALPPGVTAADVQAFENALWADFAACARDPQLAASRGVRVAQIEAIAQRMQQGDVWEIRLDHAGGLNLRRVQLTPAIRDALQAQPSPRAKSGGLRPPLA